MKHTFLKIVMVSTLFLACSSTFAMLPISDIGTHIGIIVQTAKDIANAAQKMGEMVAELQELQEQVMQQMDTIAQIKDRIKITGNPADWFSNFKYIYGNVNNMTHTTDEINDKLDEFDYASDDYKDRYGYYDDDYIYHAPQRYDKVVGLDKAIWNYNKTNNSVTELKEKLYKTRTVLLEKLKSADTETKIQKIQGEIDMINAEDKAGDAALKQAHEQVLTESDQQINAGERYSENFKKRQEEVYKEAIKKMEEREQLNR